MTFNSFVFLVDSIRSKKAVRNRQYQGKRTSDSAISCTAWVSVIRVTCVTDKDSTADCKALNSRWKAANTLTDYSACTYG